jgi:phage recombination protein Bet
MEAGTLVRRDDAPLAIGEPAYKRYDPEKIKLIKATCMPPEASDGDLYMLLELSARYKLDPFVRQIWAVKMKGRQGEKGGVTIMVGRDGILSIASQRKDYRGFRSGVVHENDEFSVDLGGDEPEIVHKAGHPKDRGEIVGAWCVAYREGRKPRYFFAPYEEYVPKSESKLQYSPWATTKSVMIEKCAITTAHRLQFEITGLYEPDEMAQALVEGDGSAGAAPADYGDDPRLALHLAQLFDAAEEARPGSFLPAKRAQKLRERQTEEERRGLAAELAEFIERHGGDVPEYPEEGDAEVVVPEDEVSFEDSPAAPVDEACAQLVSELVAAGHDWEVVQQEVANAHGEESLAGARTVYDDAVAAEADAEDPPGEVAEPEEPEDPQAEQQLPV